MTKTERSGKLFKAAFTILFREKKLLIFPLITTGLSLAVFLFFIAPIALQPDGHPYFSAEHWSAVKQSLHANFIPHHQSPGNSLATWGQNGWVTPAWVVWYFVAMFLATFSNAAFYHEIIQALNGQPVSLRRGYGVAAARWKAILLWSLFAGLVGYLLNLIEQRVGFLGKIITGFIGTAWSLASIFVIPTLVRDPETTNPVRLLRLSAGTLKRTWGELVIGFVRVEFALIFIIMLLVFVPIMLTGNVAPHYFFTVFLITLPVAIIASIANRVYQCALFVFATEGVIPEPFDKELLDSAWKVR